MVDLRCGDCLELMKDISDKSIDMILCDYKNGLSMRKIAIKYHTNHHKISRILTDNGVPIRQPKNTRGLRKYETLEKSRYGNMKNHLRFNVSIDWLCQFDFDMLKMLNEAITNRDNRWDITDEQYVQYIEHFYYDEQFRTVYKRYKTNPCKYLKPSIDHIVPKSKGGTNDLSNLQFLSWFENRCKNDMTQQEWEDIKRNINTYLI
ncbi:MAG: HNH endonuclease [Kurthia sp.]|nr:HNH endonuclease [Candidatus Kurthia equi]